MVRPVMADSPEGTAALVYIDHTGLTMGIGAHRIETLQTVAEKGISMCDVRREGSAGPVDEPPSGSAEALRRPIE